MNKPEYYAFTENDIVKKYERFNDLKKVSEVYRIETKEVKRILRRKGVIE